MTIDIFKFTTLWYALCNARHLGSVNVSLPQPNNALWPDLLPLHWSPKSLLLPYHGPNAGLDKECRSLQAQLPSSGDKCPPNTWYLPREAATLFNRHHICGRLNHTKELIITFMRDANITNFVFSQ